MSDDVVEKLVTEEETEETEETEEDGPPKKVLTTASSEFLKTWNDAIAAGAAETGPPSPSDVVAPAVAAMMRAGAKVVEAKKNEIDVQAVARARLAALLASSSSSSQKSKPKPSLPIEEQQRLQPIPVVSTKHGGLKILETDQGMVIKSPIVEKGVVIGEKSTTFWNLPTPQMREVSKEQRLMLRILSSILKDQTVDKRSGLEPLLAKTPLLKDLDLDFASAVWILIQKKDEHGLSAVLQAEALLVYRGPIVARAWLKHYKWECTVNIEGVNFIIIRLPGDLMGEICHVIGDGRTAATYMPGCGAVAFATMRG